VTEEPRVAKDRIIFALDVSSLDDAKKLVDELGPHVGAFKVGLELLTAQGAPAVVRAIQDSNSRVFFDGKFDDIPNTIAGAAEAVAGLGVWMFNVHASAGPEAIEAAAAKKGESILASVTILTSLSEEVAISLFGGRSVQDKVLQLAQLSAEAGADAIICSPKELPVLRADDKLREIMTVVPGIRPEWAARGDQSRIMTPSQAIAAGATYIVVGRPIRQPPADIGGPAKAARRIADEIEAACS
jgi:orotidine-5'-phosphate decarboxylase